MGECCGAAPHCYATAAALQGKITVKEQRNKLLYELDRTVNKSAQTSA